jgi:hypothetical protein
MLNLLIAAYVGGLVVRLSQEYEIGDVSVADVGKAIVYPIEVGRIVVPLSVTIVTGIVTKVKGLFGGNNAPPTA